MARLTLVIGAVVAAGLAVLPAPPAAARVGASARAAGGPARPSSRTLATMAAMAHDLPGRRAARAALSPGAITGSVLAGGVPLMGACVAARGKGGVHYAMAKADGRFLISGLTPGAYTLSYRDCRAPGRYLGQQGGAGPSRVVVSPGQMTGLRPASLVAADAAKRLSRSPSRAASQSGVIEGVVRDKAGKPLAGMCVDISGGTAASGYDAEDYTNPQGRYRDPVPAGRYQVEFTTGCLNNDNYAPQWWRGAARASAATTIHLRRGQVVSGVDGSLTVGAKISGIVRYRTSSGRPLSGICVDATGYRGARQIYGFTATRRNGAFHLSGLGTGLYHLQFTPGCNNEGNYLAGTSGPVSATAGRTTSGVVGILQRGGEITGVVADWRGDGVGGICVSAQDGDNFNVAVTSADGAYTINELTSGRYTLSYSGGCGDSGSYAPQWYSHRTDAGAADTVPVITGQTTVGVNAALTRGATLSGTATDASGAAMAGLCVAATTPAATTLAGPFAIFAVAQTGADGSYQIPDLAPGQYQVSFFPECGSAANVANQWFDDASGAGTASAVSAKAGVVTSGVDATMHEAGGIRGAITTWAGKPPSFACVTATSLADGNQSTTFTVGDRYHLYGLLPGQYTVEFGGCGAPYADQWYAGQPTPATATPVTVAADRTTAAIDGALGRPGSILGTVRSGATRRPVAFACVIAYDPSTGSGNFAITGRRGRYDLTGLDTGAYWVETFLCVQGQSDLAAQMLTTPVRVAAPRPTRGVDVTLRRGGGVSGVVWSRRPRRGAADVCALALPRGVGVGYLAVTASGGGYLMSGLAKGAYDVYFSADCRLTPSGLAPQWYNGQPTSATATPVSVSPDVILSGIDARLPNDGAISGSVTGPGAAPLTGVCVAAVPVGPSDDPLAAGGGRVFGITADGSYTIADLAPGQYQVEFESGCGATGYQTQWYNGASSQAGAVVITVPSDTAVSGIDASLTPVS